MHGHEGVARDIKRRFEARLPVRLELIRRGRAATTRQLPDPVSVLPYYVPDVDVDGYPVVTITELETPAGMSGTRTIRQGIGQDAFVYRYPFRIFVYLLAETYGGAELMLKRYLTAMREVLLEDRIITDTDEAYVVVDLETITENFDSPIEDDARQVLAAGFIGVVLESTELINRVDLDPDLRLRVVGGVSATERFTGEPTGAPSTVDGGAV